MQIDVWTSEKQTIDKIEEFLKALFLETKRFSYTDRTVFHCANKN